MVCLALEGYPVLSSVSSPGGLLIPPNFPREIFCGCRRVPAGVAWPRDEATAMNDHLPWPPELPAPPWPPLSVLLWRSPSCVPVRVCPEGPPERPPPSPVELLRRGTRLPGGGSYVRVLLCVSSVPASCVHIWFVSCPCFMPL